MNTNEDPVARDFDPDTAPDLSRDGWPEKFAAANVKPEAASGKRGSNGRRGSELRNPRPDSDASGKGGAGPMTIGRNPG